MNDLAPTAPSVDSPLRLNPRAVERPADTGWTLIGGVDDVRPARLDQGGLIAPDGLGRSVDWWIGAEDRWHAPGREPSVRQRRLGPGPVVETVVRVPSGDVVATVYPAMTSGPARQRATAVEIRNDSPVPVTVALAVRPYAVDGLVGGPGMIEVIEAPQPMVTVDGVPVLILPRPPNQAAVDGQNDLFDLVESGQPVTGRATSGPIPNAVCLYPLPHQATLRFSVPQPDERSSVAVPPASPDTFPPPDRVQAGWASVIDQAGRYPVPDEGLTSRAGAARARLVLDAPRLSSVVATSDSAVSTVELPTILRALAHGGHRTECRLVLDGLSDRYPVHIGAEPQVGAELAEAVAIAVGLVAPGLAEPLLEWATRLTALVERADASAPSTPTAVAKRALARLAAQAGQVDAAEHLRLSAPPIVGPGTTAGDQVDLDALMVMAQEASAAGSWPPDDSVLAAARFWLAARALLVDEPIQVRLLPTMPSAWMGGAVEVNRAPVPGARVSFAIRWHGYRPALLWEVEPSPSAGAPGPSRWRLSCPGLDPDWATEALSGETLLAGSSSDLPSAPAAGESFS